MGAFARIESALGVTRSDLTIAFFLATTALVGLVWLTFFDNRPNPIDQGREVRAMVERSDSINLAERERKIAALEARLTHAVSLQQDSVPKWEALTPVDAARDSTLAVVEEKVSSGSARRRGGTRGGLPPGKVNINTASGTVLETLPGVGEKTAEKIIERRKQSPFRRPEDIMDVKGIGEKKFEKMKPYVVVK